MKFIVKGNENNGSSWWLIKTSNLPGLKELGINAAISASTAVIEVALLIPCVMLLSSINTSTLPKQILFASSILAKFAINILLDSVIEIFITNSVHEHIICKGDEEYIIKSQEDLDRFIKNISTDLEKDFAGDLAEDISSQELSGS